MMVDSAAPVPGRIFVSYRREETAYPAGWLYDRLTDRYGVGQVFTDVDSIRLGDDFVEVITTAVGSCDVLLALVGDQWPTITDTKGRRRLDDPDDFVRLEIEAALTRNVRVIPILVDGARMPRADELPPSLAALVRRQALELSPARFDFDFSRLLKVLDVTLAEMRTAHDDEAAATATAGNVLDQGTTQAPPAQAPGSDGSAAQSDTVVELYDDPEYTAALTAYFTDRWDTAVDLLTRVLERFPDHPQVTERLAGARQHQQLAGWDADARKAAEQGRWAVAVDALEHITAVQPDLPDTTRRLEHARTQLEITSLQADLHRMHADRQWTAVIAIGEQLAGRDPSLADPDGLVTAARAELAEAALADRYSTGLRQLDSGDRTAAAGTFAAIHAERPGYRDTAALLARARPDQPAQTAADEQPHPGKRPAPPPDQHPPPREMAAPPSDQQPRFRRRWIWAGIAAAIAAVLVIATIANITSGGDDFSVEPESGPPGTTVVVSGECQLPDGWSNAHVIFGLKFGQGPIFTSSGHEPNPDGSWRGEFSIPNDSVAGTYNVFANCYGFSTNGQRDTLRDDEAAFRVTG
jgi:TIR domain